MLPYVGTKFVNAHPMTSVEYAGWLSLRPADFRAARPTLSDTEEPGYLVEYEDGYCSWSPKEAFDKAYRDTNAMTFGDALLVLKAGRRAARRGWNGKEMWLSLSCDGKREVPADQFWSRHNAAYAARKGGTATVLPCFTMKNARGEIVMGWLASQEDMLAEDWMEVL